MWIRVAAALMLTAAGGAVGCNRAERLRYRTEICRQSEELFRVCQFHIRYDGADVYTMAGMLKRSDSFSRLSFLHLLPENFQSDLSFSAQWESALRIQQELPDDERDILARFGNILGSTDPEGQMKVIDALLDELSRLEERRTEEYLRKGRLYRSLGLLTGVLAAVLVM